MISSSTSKYLLSTSRPSRPSRPLLSPKSPSTFRIQSALCSRLDKYQSQQRLNAYLGDDVSRVVKTERISSVEQSVKLPNNREVPLKTRHENRDVQSHYMHALQVVEHKQAQLDRMIGLLDSYRVTGLRDKDMQSLREEFQRFQEDSKTMLQRQQLHSDTYVKESA